MFTAKKAKQLSEMNIGQQNLLVYDAILDACIKGAGFVEIENKNITSSEVNELKSMMGYKVSFPGNGKTKIEW